MRSRWYILCLVAVLTACQADFDPERDSSVRTVCVTLDMKDVLSNYLVAMEDTFVLGYRDSLPEDVQMRVTMYCYDENEQLLTKQTQMTRSLERMQVYLSHMDTTRVYSLCAIADFVHAEEGRVLHSSWVQMMPNTRSSLYLFHSSVEPTVENMVARARWQGYPSLQIGPLTMEPVIYNGYFRLVNFQRLNYVYFHWGRYATIWAWDAQPKSYLRYSEPIDFYPTMDMKEVCVPVHMAICNDSIYYKTKTRLVSTLDSASYYLKLGGRPFVCTVDCEKRKVTAIERY